MKNTKLQSIWVGVLLSIILVTVRSDGGRATTSGKEWRIWTEGGYSVIAAKVREVRPEQGDAGEAGGYFAVLEPLAVLAGPLDPSEHPAISVSMYVGGPGTCIASPPKAGSTILAVVQWGNFIVSDMCTFMPDGAAIAEINGLGDPRVAETLKKLQDARAHADPDPHGPPATRRAPAAKARS